MIRGLSFVIEPARAGERLDRFLSDALPTTSRALIERALEREGIRLNSRTVRKGQRLREDDRLEVLELMEQSDWRAAPNPSPPFRVLLEDAAFVVLEKPSGQPVHPLDPDETGTTVNALLAAYPETAHVGPDRLFPAIVHRLDTETSGVLLAARDETAYRHLRGQFERHTVEKKYLALVAGVVRGSGRMEHVLSHADGPEHRMLASAPGATPRGRRPMRAVTEYTVRRAAGNATLLDIVIRTGVTHQIRCQLAAGGHPILGDALYGGVSEGYAGRLFLHAAAIRFRHPRTNEPVCVESPLPEDLATVLKTV
mgnify:CR=1 FL=1